MESDLEAAEQAIAGIITSIETSGKLLADLSRKHEGFLVALHKRLKQSVSIGYLRRLVRCGNGELHPKLCLTVGPGHPFLETLSRQEQDQIIDGVRWPLGNGDHRIRPLSELSYDEAKALCYGGSLADEETIIRRMKSYAEQRRAACRKIDRLRRECESDMSKQVALVESYGIEVVGDDIRIPQNTTVPLEAMAAFLHEHGH
jgi:hypothetical protein